MPNENESSPGATVPRPRRGDQHPSSFRNTTSMLGLGLAGLTLGLMVFLYVLDLFSPLDNPYVGLITFIVLPPFLIIGLLMYFVGAWRKHRRIQRGEKEGDLPRLDFNNARHRRMFGSFAFIGVLFMAVSAFGSYQAFEYTESVEFCGKICHSVMKPEYVAYQNSPHARVTCTHCHVGEGATWYVKSKLSGAYQVYSVLFNKYERPIPTPVRDLRPAQETCEQCHWPSHFYAQKLKDRTYFAADEANTKFQMSMLMKIGGVEHGATEGIHAHMYIDHQISYIATDEQKQVIPYVEARDKEGKLTIYKSTEDEITEELIRNGERRVVDCIDCHNRPSHRYPHPAKNVNTALTKGWIDSRIPDIKRLSVEVLEKPYTSEQEALYLIQKDVMEFYEKDYPDAAKSKSKQIQAAIRQLQRIYSTSYFPEMKTNWKAFPDNLDHMYSKGCFRCHDGKHVSDTGKVISNDCNSCHTILSYKTAGGKEVVSKTGLEFQHPVDIGDEWKTTPCKDCHVPE